MAVALGGVAVRVVRRSGRLAPAQGLLFLEPDRELFLERHCGEHTGVHLVCGLGVHLGQNVPVVEELTFDPFPFHAQPYLAKEIT
jgi:hypothetical protein